METNESHWGSFLKRSCVLVAWAFAFYLFSYHFLWYPLHAYGIDFPKHWYAGLRIVQGISPYDGELYLGFNYPLFVAFLYTPLTLFTLQTAETVFDWLNFFYLVGVVIIITFALKPTVSPNRWWVRDFWGPMVMFMLSQSNSLRRLIWSSNLDGINILVLTCLMVFFVKNKQRLAGFALAIAVLIKVLPVLLFIPILALRKWQTAFTAAAVLIFYWLLLFMTGWLKIELFLFHDTLPSLPWYWRDISISVHNSVAEHFFGWENLTEPFYKKLVFAVNVFMLAGLVALGWFRWEKVKDSPTLIMVFSLQWLVLFSPLLEIIHVAWALPALFVGSYEWAERRIPTIVFLGWFLSWVFILNLETMGIAIDHALGLHLGSHFVMLVLVMLSLLTTSYMVLFSWNEESPT